MEILKIKRKVRRVDKVEKESLEVIEDEDAIRALREIGMPSELEVSKIEPLKYEPIEVRIPHRPFRLEHIFLGELSLGVKSKSYSLIETVEHFFEKGTLCVEELWTMATSTGYKREYQAKFVLHCLKVAGLNEEQIVSLTGYSSSTVNSYLREAERENIASLSMRVKGPIQARKTKLVFGKLYPLFPGEVKSRLRYIHVPSMTFPVQKPIQIQKLPEVSLRARFRLKAMPIDAVAGIRLRLQLFQIKPALAELTFAEVSICQVSLLSDEFLEGVASSGDLTSVLLLKPVDALGLGAKYVGEPVIILVPAERLDYSYVILEICKELYREARGGLPTPYIFVDPEQFKQWVELGYKFSDKIAFFDLKKVPLERMFEKQKQIFRELFSQSFCFLLFYASKSELDRLRLFINSHSRPYLPKIIELNTVENIYDAKNFANISCIIWGLNVEKMRDLYEVSFLSPSQVMGSIERAYKDAIHKILALREYVFKIKRGEKETEDHLALKVLAMKHLVEEENVNVEKIKSEVPLGEKVVADLFVEDGSHAVEVETFYGAGSAPLLNVRDSVLKYKDLPVKMIYVVLRNLPTSLYLSSLVKLRKELKNSMKDRKIEFFVPDLSKLKLLSLTDLLRRLLEVRLRVMKGELLRVDSAKEFK